MPKIKLINDDCFNTKYTKFLLSAGIDLVLTDVPFNIADRGKVTKSHGKLWSTAEAWGETFKDSFTEKEYDEFIEKFLRYAFVLLKPGGSLVTFIDDKYAGILIRIAERINEEQQKKNPKQPCGFIHKKNIHFVKINCVPKLRQYNYASACEIAVWLLKPQLKGSKTKPGIFNYTPPTKGLRHPDGKLDIKEYHNSYTSNVFLYNIGKKRTSHPCEKYTAMLKPLVETHSNPGSVVLDPFFGGGNSALTCYELKRNFIGFEIEKEWYNKADALLRALIANE